MKFSTSKKHASNKFIYFCLSIFSVATFCYLNFKREHYKIVVLWTGAGEREWAKRIEDVCHSLKFECLSIFYPQRVSELERLLLSDCIPNFPVDEAVEKFRSDFIISLNKRCKKISCDTKNYLAISGDSKTTFDATYSDVEDLLKFDGFLYASDHVDKLKSFVESRGKKFIGIVWYPSCGVTQYLPPVPQKLFYCGFQWDDKRNGKEYQKMFSLLDQQGYFQVYGPPEQWQFAPNSAQGSLPFDGKSICKAIHNCGIALVLHAQPHIELHAPTSRIFEAASACSIIISDKNPFICKEFGDSVLYVDGKLNGQELFEQIDNHVKWILSHPEEAQQMAQKAHAIFLEKFTLERQIKNLIEMHKKLT